MICIGCGADFPYAPRQQRCTPDCGRVRPDHGHAARTTANRAHELEFIGVDGEGIGSTYETEEWDDDENGLVIRKVAGHDYVLLSVGQESLHRGGAPLHHLDVFAFLWEQYLTHPHAVFVGFFLNYDFCQWLKSLSVRSATKMFHPYGIESRTPRNPNIHQPFPVYVDGWEIDILGKVRFKIRPNVRRADWPACQIEHRKPELIAECETGAHRKHPHRWMYVCDAGDYFQTSFLTAIDPSDWGDPVVSDDEFTTLKSGKDHRDCTQEACRGNLGSECPGIFGEEMTRYNRLENEVLARMMVRVNEGFVADDIRLKNNQWFGPGQAAQTWLTSIGVPTGETIRDAVPQSARDAARESYVGGWFEIMRHGVIPGTTYGYDINSAYPFIMSTLPCLRHGEWTEGAGAPKRLRPGVLRLVDATVRGRSEYIGTMPHRTPQGTIVRPQATSGWYWWHEVQAARAAGLISSVVVHHWIEYQPCACPPPVAPIRDLYQGRLVVGKNSAFGKSKKLVYNACAGKFMQSIGQPRFGNPIYGSLITAGCRTMILHAIATHPDKAASVVMVATDSVTFLTPHPGLHCHPSELGAWEAKEHQNLSLMMPGMYWDDSTRAAVRAKRAPRFKSRGVSAKDLVKFINDIDAQWALFATEEYPVWPTVEIPIGFGMISAKMAMARDRWDLCGRVVLDGVRKLTANPVAKRWPTDLFGMLDGRTIPYREMDPFRSTPYGAAFGDEDARPWEVRADRDLLTPDGPMSLSIRNVLPSD